VPDQASRRANTIVYSQPGKFYAFEQPLEPRTGGTRGSHVTADGARWLVTPRKAVLARLAGGATPSSPLH
jgi:hypothetical protein